ncbi:MAG: hypothetical protein V3T23_08085 [Nitrososphaerales archaeon]
MQPAKIVTVKLRVPKDWIRVDLNHHLEDDNIRIQSVKFPSKPGMGSRKGGEWERQFARQLSLWWTNQVDDCVFYRLGGSGGAKRDKQGKTGSAGDIRYEKPKGKFLTDRYTFELKSYGDVTQDLWSVLVGNPTARVTEWWEHVLSDAAIYGRRSLLILRTNNRAPIFLCDDMELYKYIWQTSFKGEMSGRQFFMAPISEWWEVSPHLIMDKGTKPQEEKVHSFKFNRISA